jgi:hypothetical protein
MYGGDNLPIGRCIRTCSQIIYKVNICLSIVKKKQDREDFKKLRKKTKKIQNFLKKKMIKC